MGTELKSPTKELKAHFIAKVLKKGPATDFVNGQKVDKPTHTNFQLGLSDQFKTIWIHAPNQIGSQMMPDCIYNVSVGLRMGFTAKGKLVYYPSEIIDFEPVN